MPALTVSTTRAAQIQNQTTTMKTIATIATIASAHEQEIITGHYGLPVARLTETPAEVIESDGETEIRLADGTTVTIYDSVEPLVEFPAA